MRKLILIGALSVSAAMAHAVFTTTTYVMSVVTATSIETQTPTSIKRVISGFNVGPNGTGNIAWTMDFNTGTAPAFQAVTMTIKGTVSPGADLRVRGSENVFNTDPSVSLIGTGLASLNLFVPTGTAPQNFIATVTIPFSQPSSIGFASKDISIRNVAGLGLVTVTEVDQEFVPVPEPASMLALGLGVATLIRKRRK